jgi:hypothetical protein
MNKKKSFSISLVKSVIVLSCLVMTTLGFSQNNKCIIYFKDNTKVEGLGKLKMDGQVKFRLNEDSEKVFYEPKFIDRVEMNEGRLVTYKYKKIDDFGSEWLEVLVDGKACLYTNSITYNNPSMGMGGMNGGMGFSGGGTVTYYYANHTGENTVYRIATYGGISRRFKKTGANFFKDCPTIVEKIENGTYKKDDLEQIVKFYNLSNCGEGKEEALKTEVKTN